VVPISSNNALFSLLGTTYGGDGVTTFALPDLRGRAPIHDGSGNGLTPRQLGEMAGSETATLVAGNIPPVACTVQASATASSKSPAGNVPAFNPDASAYGSPDGTTMAATMVQTNSGGPTPVATVPPFLAMNYCIAVQGIYPSRP
jgi:microcystin-dependent protein